MSMQMVKRAGCMENLKLLGETQPGPKCPEQELVELTQVHPLFQHLYNFPSYHEVSVHFFRGKQGGPQLSQFLFFLFYQ
jgi:hypothetical protein